MLSHGNVVAAAAATAFGLGLRSDDVVETAIPMTSSGGFHVAIFSALFAGATMVIDPPFDAAWTFARFESEKATVYIAVPSVFAFLLDAHDPGQHDSSSLRLFDFGASSMTGATISKLKSAFPHVELRQNYGLTESGPVGTYLAGEYMESKLGSIGRPILCQARVVSDEGRDADTGELWLRGPGVMMGYFNSPEETAAALTEDAWLKTGDVVRVDADGFYFHLDRKKDVIKRGGYGISSVEVENALTRHPSVLEVAVVGVPHSRLGEDLFAFVVPRSGVTLNAADLTLFCADKIADNKIPRRVQVVSKLPKSPIGKILKRELRSEAERIVLQANTGKGAE
jgi:acyl-CoA synthetase (AMP-forming)/AMP-acid ligase II